IAPSGGSRQPDRDLFRNSAPSDATHENCSLTGLSIYRLRGPDFSIGISQITFTRMNGVATSMKPGAALVVPPEPLIVVEHPCIVKNAGKAIKSLGGRLLLDELLNEPSLDKFIEASLRPDDPFAKTVPAGPVSTGNVLLKITVPKMTGRKRKRGSDEQFQFHS